MARGEQLDVEAAAGEVAERQHGLHGGDPGAGDENTLVTPTASRERRGRTSAGLRRAGRRTTEQKPHRDRMAAPTRGRTVATCSSAAHPAAAATCFAAARCAGATWPARWPGRRATTAFWLIDLRCGDCEHVWDAVIDNTRAARYDAELDGDMAAIRRALQRLDCARMAAEVDAFVAALSCDLIEPADFAA